MKTILAVAAAAALAGLTACSASTPVPDASSAAPSPLEPGPTLSARPTGSAGAKEACVLFNDLVAGYAAVPPGDPD